MPKATSTKSSSKKAANSASLSIPGHAPAAKKSTTRKKDVPPTKKVVTPVVPAAAPPKPSKVRATIVKAPKKVVESEDDDVSNGSDGANGNNTSEEEDFADDGMSVNGASDNEGPPARVLDLVNEFNMADGSDEDMEDDDDQPIQLSLQAVKHKRKPDAQLSTGTPTQVSKAVSKRAGPVPPAPRTPTNAAAASTRAQDYTPYVNKVNEKDHSKPLLSQQTPTSRNIVKGAQHLVRANIVAKNAFPEDDSREEDCERFIIRVAKGIDAERRILRFELDTTYHENMVKMVGRAGTQVRGETASAARDLVGSLYQLGQAKGTVEQNKLFVEFLLTNGNFLYRDLEWEVVDEKTIRCIKRRGPYRHVIIPTLVEQEFFHGHERMAVAEETAALFNPIPIAVIAFAATAVQCSLRDWTSGVRVKSSSSFSADEWSGIYQGHVRELERMQQAKPVDVDKWLRSEWKKAWGTTRQHLAGNTTDVSFISAAEMDDFSDITDDA